MVVRMAEGRGLGVTVFPDHSGALASAIAHGPIPTVYSCDVRLDAEGKVDQSKFFED